MSICFSCGDIIFPHIMNIRSKIQGQKNSAEIFEKHFELYSIEKCCRPAIMTILYPKDLENQKRKDIKF